jgi:hypothetical protein
MSTRIVVLLFVLSLTFALAAFAVALSVNLATT